MRTDDDHELPPCKKTRVPGRNWQHVNQTHSVCVRRENASLAWRFGGTELAAERRGGGRRSGERRRLYCFPGGEAHKKHNEHIKNTTSDGATTNAAISARVVTWVRAAKHTNKPLSSGVIKPSFTLLRRSKLLKTLITSTHIGPVLSGRALCKTRQLCAKSPCRSQVFFFSPPARALWWWSIESSQASLITTEAPVLRRPGHAEGGCTAIHPQKKTQNTHLRREVYYSSV